MKIEIPDNVAESAELKPLIEQIQAIIDREAKAGAFVPKNGDKYWFNYESDDVRGPWHVVWMGTIFDKSNYIAGNCYPTREAAESAAPEYLAKLDAQYAIALWIAKHKDWLSTEAEKANTKVGKFHAAYNHETDCFTVGIGVSCEPAGVTSFGYRRPAEQFIADCGEHLLTVYGLKEEGE